MPVGRVTGRWPPHRIPHPELPQLLVSFYGRCPQICGTTDERGFLSRNGGDRIERRSEEGGGIVIKTHTTAPSKSWARQRTPPGVLYGRRQASPYMQANTYMQLCQIRCSRTGVNSSRAARSYHSQPCFGDALLVCFRIHLKIDWELLHRAEKQCKQSRMSFGILI